MEAALEAAGVQDDRGAAMADRARRMAGAAEEAEHPEWRSRRDELLTEMVTPPDLARSCRGPRRALFSHGLAAILPAGGSVAAASRGRGTADARAHGAAAGRTCAQAASGSVCGRPPKSRGPSCTFHRLLPPSARRL